MKVDGGCFCGMIRYEAEVDAARVVICHCSDCQTLSGTAFRTAVPTRSGTFRLLAASPRIFVKTADSGNRRAQAFCADCGTPIYAAPADGGTDVVALRVGTIRQRDDLVPAIQIWHRSAQRWICEIASIHRIDTQAENPPVAPDPDEAE